MSYGTVGLYPSLAAVNGRPAISYYDATNGDLNYVRATNSLGTAWGDPITGNPITIDTTGNVGLNTNLAVINGFPTIFYYDATRGDLKYVRAVDNIGNTWGAAQNIDTTGTVGEYNSITTTINGYPAISYYDNKKGDLKYATATDLSGTAWNIPITLDTAGNTGQYSNVIIVKGNPAISYYDITNTGLKYVRATDNAGNTWGTPVGFNISGKAGQYTCLEYVSGHPAMSYYDQTNGKLLYIRSSKNSGSSWGTQITVDTNVKTGLYNSLKMISGNPAISYYDQANGNLKYVRALDTIGTNWGTPITISSAGDIGRHTCLVTANGNPAISYYDATNGDLKYVRANDATGSSWGAPVTISSIGNTGLNTNMLIVHGMPAISYYDQTKGDLKYILAADSSGNTWGTEMTLDTSGDVGAFTSLAIINGFPAISYYDQTNTALKYVRAADANGNTWGNAQKVDSASKNGWYTNLAFLDGKPVISYYNAASDNLKYVRANDASGNTWKMPIVLDAAGGQYNSMISNGTDVYVSYYNSIEFLPYFIHGTNSAWTGGAGTTDWFTAGNWGNNSVPTTTSNIGISGGLNIYPDIPSGIASCKDIQISSGASVIVSGGTLQIAGEIINSGTLNATSGSVSFNGNEAQTIPAATFTSNSVKNLAINNSAGVTLNGLLIVLDTYTPVKGFLTTNDYLILRSNSSGTARIASGNPAGGYINGGIIIERFVPGKRANRLLSHPFSTSIPLSKLQDDIDITGSGGSVNGFTTTAQNTPSAFWFDVAAADNSTVSTNPGWTAFTNTNGAGINAWQPYTAARILIAGTPGQGLNGLPYNPNSTLLDITGTVNQGDITVNLTKGNNTDFVAIGNPFPSQISMDKLTTTNVGSSFYIWDATQGIYGGYTSYPFGSSAYKLPSCGAFITTLTANGSIVFKETDKSTGKAGIMFKTTNSAYTVELRIEDNNTFWDRLLLRFDDSAMATMDYPDARKLYNPDISFYTWSKDDSMLSIDVRPYTEDEVIKLGINTTVQRNLTISATDFNIPAGTKLFLKDKYLNKTEEITGSGYEYAFTIDGNPSSWGDNRFELNTKGKPTGILAEKNIKPKVKLVPNPATNNVCIYYEGFKSGNTQIIITNAMGIKVTAITKASTQTGVGSVDIPLENIPTGLYMVTIQNNGSLFTQKLIKQ